MRIADDILSSVMQKCHNEFYKYLDSIQISQIVNKDFIVKGFTAEQIIKMINFFFNQIMGLSNLFYIVSLINYYTITQINNLNHDLIRRASELTADNNKSLAVRYFFDTVF